MKRLRARIAQAEDTGFTLIELLIVIVILGILAGIAIFAVGGFRDSAKSACTQANQRISDTVTAANTINPSGSYTTDGKTCPP
jgi:prepilin-type N-terminal cleavage/methylation domain-containing protein